MNPPAVESEVDKESEQVTGLYERLRIWFVACIGYWTILLLGKTLRWEIEGWENYRVILESGKRIIYTFWHGRIFLATYFWRNRGIAVMTSQNRDGEYIARVIRRFGYAPARGSSSRGGRQALVEMIQAMRKQRDVAFTIDGPRGPRYVAKPGAVWIASKTGSAVFPFHISPEKKWVLRSWDQFLIPKPFTRALVLMAPAIYVEPDATEQNLEAAQQQLQRSLDELRERGDSRWKGENRNQNSGVRHQGSDLGPSDLLV